MAHGLRYGLKVRRVSGYTMQSARTMAGYFVHRAK
eukprot:SAG31_NODE_36835_length_309_cov_6.509524_1_plen_34_part_10